MVNRAAKEQAGIDTNWIVKAYSLIAAALNAIYKANQSTNQGRIHTGFHRFTEIGQIFHNKYIFNNKKHFPS